MKLLSAASLSGMLLCSQVVWAANSGVYMGVTGAYDFMQYKSGTQSSQEVNGNSFSGTAYHGKDVGWMEGAQVGYLYPVDLGMSVGGELGYSYYGSPHSSTYVSAGQSGELKDQFQSLNLLGVVDFSLIGGFDAFLKAGAAFFRYDQTGSGQADGLNFSSIAKGVSYPVLPMIQIGVGYALAEGLNLSTYFSYLFGADYKDGGNTSQKVPAMSQIGMSLSYFFGDGQ